MNHKLNTFILLAALVMLTLNARAQVGINNANPDSCSILHISDGKRGVILPSIPNDSSITKNKNGTYTPGLTYYNNTVNKFHYHNGTEWQILNPWNSKSGSSEISTDKTVTAPTVNATTVEATTVAATTVSGFGTIPVGGIIMWSGTTPPPGWALCDGTTVNGHTTPTLSGRFIVAYDNTGAKPEYNTPGNTGGNDNVTIQEANLPNHTHTGVTTSDGIHQHFLTMKYKGYRHGDNGTEYTPIGKIDPDTDLEREGKTNIDGNHDHNITVSSCATCTATPIDVRPSYYVLAFIMRVN